MKRNADIREYIRAFYQGNRLNFALALLFTVLSTGGMLFFSWVLGEITNIITAGSLERLGGTLRFSAVAIVVLLWVELLMYRFKARFIHQALRQYKDLAFSRLAGKNISAFSRENTGRYLSALTNDTNSIEENYLNRTLLLVFYCAMFVGGLAMMLWLSWKLTLAAGLLSLLPILCSLVMGKGLAVREQAVSDQNERFVSQVKDFLSGFSVIKSFKAEQAVTDLFQSANDSTERTKERRRWWEYLLTATAEASGTILQMGIFFYGAWLAIRGEIDAGTVLVTLNLCNCVIQPIQIIPQYQASRKAALALIQKLAQITRENARHAGTAIPPFLDHSISLSHVAFGYAPDKPVLKDLSTRFEAGKSYAVVGPSGSGKSTLLNLLMGSDPDYTGSIAIDGQELRAVDTDSLYDLMSLIGQNVFLFDDTIQNNITMFRDFPDRQVDLAIKRSGLSAIVAERGMDYRCGENGCNLSGGERQRISIARALLRGTPVLLLDEATAALDNQTTFDVTDAILHLDGLTRIVVTHRLDAALMEQYDQIIVMKDGRIVETGGYRELMDAKAYFYSLFTLAA